MNKKEEFKEIYVGCDCMSLDHISHFVHFPLSEIELKENALALQNGSQDDENIIYFAVKVHNYFRAILPPFFYLWNKYDRDNYLQLTWFRRVLRVFKHIVGQSSLDRFGMFDSFNFQPKDLDTIDAFLSLISSDISVCISHNSELEIDDEYWTIRFCNDQFVFDNGEKHPWEFGWEINFKKGNILKRIRDSFRYLFGNHSDEMHIEIDAKNAAKIRGMIKWNQHINKEI